MRTYRDHRFCDVITLCMLCVCTCTAQFTPPARQDGPVCVVSGGVNWVGPTSASASECVRRSHCATRHTLTQTRHRTHLSGDRADSIHTATPDTTKQSWLCRVLRGGVNWTIAINVFKVQNFLSATVLSCLESNSHRRSGVNWTRQDSFVWSGVAVWISFKCSAVISHLTIRAEITLHNKAIINIRQIPFAVWYCPPIGQFEYIFGGW